MFIQAKVHFLGAAKRPPDFYLGRAAGCREANPREATERLPEHTSSISAGSLSSRAGDPFVLRARFHIPLGHAAPAAAAEDAVVRAGGRVAGSHFLVAVQDAVTVDVRLPQAAEAGPAACLGLCRRLGGGIARG